MSSRGIVPGVTGSLATGATYFGVIESTKKWIDESHPSLGGHWAHFIAGAIGDTLGSFVYVPCEVMKQRMQVQGSRKYWTSVTLNDAHAKPGLGMYNYYSGVLEAGCSIWKEQGPKALYAGLTGFPCNKSSWSIKYFMGFIYLKHDCIHFHPVLLVHHKLKARTNSSRNPPFTISLVDGLRYWSTLARDVPFAGLMVTFYEAFKSMTEYGKQKFFPDSGHLINSSVEGLLLGGMAGGLSAYLTTPLDVIKTRLQVQGPTARYNGWRDAVHKIWLTEGAHGMFRGSIARIMWYIQHLKTKSFWSLSFLGIILTKDWTTLNYKKLQAWP
ncbi:hypothetical protein Leryth_024089 [Lithospermum erythrorhizon]|nr:hypothetical protein Leryth_024089 [Lithospermum erythrorhizon]